MISTKTKEKNQSTINKRCSFYVKKSKNFSIDKGGKYIREKELSGITLLALVVTIIVLLILAGVTISGINSDNGVLSQARRATLANSFAKWKEEMDMNIMSEKIDDQTAVITATKNDMKKYIPDLPDDYLEKFIIANSELCYIGNDEKEIEIARGAGINTDLTTNASAQDVIAIYDSIIPIKNKTKQDSIGTALIDKDANHSTDWNLIITYNSSNQETGRYGSGYRYLTPGTYTGKDGKNIKISGNYVLNFTTQKLIGLYNYKNWNINSTLAVNKNIAVNIDPTNLEGDDWRTDGNFQDYYVDGENTGIQKTGDVIYDKSTKALKFNESVDNTKGGGGYIKLMKLGVDFSQGFTFEMYANLSRLRYDNGNKSLRSVLQTDEVNNSGLFCRMPSLNSYPPESIRFGYCGVNTICKFTQADSWTGEGKNIKTMDEGSVAVITDYCGYNTGADFYLTFVYVVYNEEKSAEYRRNHLNEYNSGEGNFDSKMDEAYQKSRADSTGNTKYIDKVLYYVNGELYGYTYYGHDSYINGCNTWNKDSCPFFLGVCPWYTEGNLYYLKGSVYACRLYYNNSLTPDEVKANRNATMQYRSSF